MKRKPGTPHKGWKDAARKARLPKVDSEGLRLAAKEGHARVSSVVNVKK